MCLASSWDLLGAKEFRESLHFLITSPNGLNAGKIGKPFLLLIIILQLWAGPDFPEISMVDIAFPALFRWFFCGFDWTGAFVGQPANHLA